MIPQQHHLAQINMLSAFSSAYAACIIAIYAPIVTSMAHPGAEQESIDRGDESNGPAQTSTATGFRSARSFRVPETAMRALSISRFTGLSDLELTQVPDPTVDAGESLVQVRAVALSRTDLAVLGDRTAGESKPIIPGLSVAGTVVHDRRYPSGTPVAIDPYHSCGTCPTCQVSAGCATPSVLGRDRPGGIAEYVSTMSRSLVPLPRTLSLVEGAAIAASGSIASKVLIDDARVTAGERILLTGSTGALGLTVLQLARALGCHVSALVTRSDRVDLALQAGAHQAMAMTSKRRSPTAEDLGGQVDVVVHLAKDAGWLPGLMGSLRVGGRVVMRRVRAGTQLDLDMGRLATAGYRLIGSTGSGAVGLPAAISALAAAPVSPVISEVLPWEDHRTGLKLFADRANRGAVVLKVG